MRSTKIIFLVFFMLILLCVVPTMASDTGSIGVISNPSGSGTIVPSFKITSSKTNSVIFPGDDIILTITDFNPTRYWTGFPVRMWILWVLWDRQYLDLFKVDDSGCGDHWLMNGCDDAGYVSRPIRLWFHVLESTPLRTTTIVNFIGGLFNWNPPTPENPGGSIAGGTQVEIPYSVYVPEFPSPYLPAIAIIGFLGVVYYIKRTKEH